MSLTFCELSNKNVIFVFIRDIINSKIIFYVTLHSFFALLLKSSRMFTIK